MLGVLQGLRNGKACSRHVNWVAMAAIIFDFDGTIAYSFDYVADFLAREAGLPELTSQQKDELRGLSMIAMARHLGHGWWRLPGLFFRGRREMGRVIKKVAPIEGIEQVIKKIHGEGHTLFIVSSNSVANVHAFLHAKKLHTYFLEIYGSIGSFSKAPALRRLLKENQLETKDAIYIGDELRDVEAAQSLGLRVVAVTWGFARPADIEELKPTAVANDSEELIRILEEV